MPENGVELDNQDQKLEPLTTPSSGAGEKHSNEKATCNFKRGGHCTVHNCNAKKINVTAKIWKDRGGGRGFGYVTTNRVKYICQAGNILAKQTLKNSQDRERGPDN